MTIIIDPTAPTPPPATSLALVGPDGAPLPATTRVDSIYTPPAKEVEVEPTRVYHPLHETVVIRQRETKERKSAGGLFLPSDNDGAFILGTIVAVGTGEILYDGTIRKLAVEVGDIVLFNWGEAARVGTGDDKVFLCSERSILAKVTLVTHDPPAADVIAPLAPIDARTKDLIQTSLSDIQAPSPEPGSTPA